MDFHLKLMKFSRERHYGADYKPSKFEWNRRRGSRDALGQIFAFFSSQRSKLDEAGLLDANAVVAGVVGRSPRCWEVTAGVDERLELRCGCTWCH